MLTLAPDAVIRERDLTREAELVRGVAFALLHFTPHVVLAEEAVVLADVSASLRLFGGIRPLRRLARETVIAFGVTATLAVAPTGEAAWLFAQSSGGIALSLRSVDRALSRVPLPALPPARPTPNGSTAWDAKRWTTSGACPAQASKKRCGTALLNALDRATGAAPEVYEWLEMPPAFSARLELPDRIEHAEAVLFAARRLILQMTGWLSARQLAIARFVLERGRAAVPPTAIDVALAEPPRGHLLLTSAHISHHESCVHRNVYRIASDPTP
ncbi:UNVERIFIED_ORG: nucleotidyltransferase/DNA polymerase involved in DNA repair [Burkholderia sp. 1263]|nr:nucleotidyltransferase/DNA polymerase involved in DNA repair [Paraburkholderia terricola]